MSKRKKSKVGAWLFRILFTILLLVSLGLIFNQQIKNWMVSSYQPKVTKQTVKKNEKKKANFNFKDAKTLTFSTVAKARLNQKKLSVVGEILVPKSNVHLPIGKGVSNETLALAAGTMRPDQKMGTGNYPLAGHHMVRRDILFSPLYFKTKVGDSIYLTNMRRVYRYKVYTRKFIAATRIDVVNQTKKPIITLVTCDATGARRLMLRGKLVDSTSYANTSVSIKKQFNESFNNK
ncbi:class A sortase [Secundilactobacillus malefermentans]|uniref:class A sortase n=1 Tax=Secundilactobacillus malefermentans TaxID=176292 RepID=UPI0011CBEED7|nr:class A sortase [Secundilactobacillus malefermentans]QEA31940.1 class A sortase [Secundilactobacillus malefermentans]